jgi:hypothetical protein
MKKNTILRLLFGIISQIIVCQTFGQNLILQKHPVNFQLFTRNAENKAVVEITGRVVKTGIDSLVLTVSENEGTLLRNAIKVDYTNDKATFAFSLEIKADTANYTFSLDSKTGAIATNEFIADHVVCGDAFIVSGQSNASCWIVGSDYTNQWIRSFGSENPNPSIVADTAWGIAQAKNTETLLSIGDWPMRMAKHIVENQGIAVCVINGALAGTSIEKQLPIESDHKDLNTIYGRLNYRVNKAGVANKIRAILWHQGESNTSEYSNNTWISHTPDDYLANFDLLYNSWKADYLNTEKIYIFQIRPGCGATKQREIRELQRNIPHLYDDVSIISTNGIPGHDGCHYSIEGYQDLGDKVYRFLDVDLYSGEYDIDITSPDIIKAFISNSDSSEVTLVFNQPVVWNETAEIGGNPYFLLDFFYIDDVSYYSENYTVKNNTVVIKINRSVSAKTVSYLPNDYYPETTDYFEGPWLMGDNGLGVLGFYNFPIEINTTAIASRNADTFSIFRVSKDYLSVKLNAAMTVEKYEVIDCSGRVIETGSLSKGLAVCDLNVSQLQEGVFLLRITGKNISQTFKFIK